MKNIEIILCSRIKKASHFWSGGGTGKSHDAGDKMSGGGFYSRVMKKPDAYSENDAKNEDRSSLDAPAGKELQTGHLWVGSRTVTGSGNGPQVEPDVQGGFRA